MLYLPPLINFIPVSLIGGEGRLWSCRTHGNERSWRVTGSGWHQRYRWFTRLQWVQRKRRHDGTTGKCFEKSWVRIPPDSHRHSESTEYTVLHTYVGEDVCTMKQEVVCSNPARVICGVSSQTLGKQ